MPIQALKSQSLVPSSFTLKEKDYEKHSYFSYHSLLSIQNHVVKKQMDHFLKFSQMNFSQNLSTALGIFEGKDVAKIEEDAHLDSAPQEVEPIRQIFDMEGRLIQLISSDGTINYKINYKGLITIVTNELTKESHLQETDPQGRLIREVFPCGLEISWKFDGEFVSEMTLPDLSKIFYQVVDPNHVNIQRLNPTGRVEYQHIYEAVDDCLTKEVLIGDAGIVNKQYDKESKTLITTSNQLHMVDQYDTNENLISRTLKDLNETNSFKTFTYPAGSLLFKEKRDLDELGRVIQFNGFKCLYDENGRLIQKTSSDQTTHYGYDAFDRLTSVEMGNKKIQYTYDLSGRRLSKTIVEDGGVQRKFYLYQGVNQIGVYNKNKELIHQRILGVGYHSHLPLAIAIESQGKVYAPIHSSNFNIFQLVDKDSGEVIHYEALNPCGENIRNFNPICPWIFATKYYDTDTGLVDFGDRQYDPSIRQWTSADPDERACEANKYVYCNNNPLNFIDPDGQWAIFIPLLLSWKAAAAAVGLGLLAGGATIAADKAVKKIDNKHLALAVGGIGSWAVGAAINKIKDMPFPDRELPQDKHGNPVPDTDDPHTQLGQHQGSKEKYPKAREFGKDGEHVRDIEFTDHCRPEYHPLPHQHQRKDNPSGGTKERGEPEHVPEWNYEEN